MKRYISDLHFFSRQAKPRDGLPGLCLLEEMHAHMIAAWNQTVSPKDEVFILATSPWERPRRPTKIVRQLKGELYLIRGNHDYYLKKSTFDRSRFHWIQDYAEILRRGKKGDTLALPGLFVTTGQNRLTARESRRAPCSTAICTIPSMRCS